MNLISRRHFLRLSANSGLAFAGMGLLTFSHPAGAGEAFKRASQARLLLSMAAYSFRQYFKDSSHQREFETDPAHPLVRNSAWLAINSCPFVSIRGSTAWFHAGNFS